MLILADLLVIDSRSVEKSASPSAEARRDAVRRVRRYAQEQEGRIMEVGE